MWPKFKKKNSSSLKIITFSWLLGSVLVFFKLNKKSSTVWGQYVDFKKLHISKFLDFLKWK